MVPENMVPVAEPIRFGKFWLIEKVASGGMAEIFRAVALTADGRRQSLAIKRILPQFSNDEEFVSMMVDEAKLMVLLNHPNIVPMMEFGKIEDSYYIAMEYVDGPTLKGLFRRVLEDRQQFPIDLAVHIVREIGIGLAYAHRKSDEQGHPLGLVHRDISPTNILISYDGEVKVADFGISKASNQSHRTQIGVIRGKTGYMSPEQTKANTVIDQRSDIYSMGIILFELLTGKRLYQAESIPEALRMIRKGEIPPITGLRPDVPAALEAITMRALAPESTERYQQSEQMVDALNEFLTRWSRAGRPVRVTHTDLVGFLRRFYAAEMSAREVEATSQIAVDDGATQVDIGNAETAVQTGSQTAVTKPHTIAANPLYELSEQEFELPPQLRPGGTPMEHTAPSDMPQTTSLQDALSASLRIAQRFSPMVISAMAAGALVFGLLLWTVRRPRDVSSTPVPETTPTINAGSTTKGPPISRSKTIELITEPSVLSKVLLDGIDLYGREVICSEKSPCKIENVALGSDVDLTVIAKGYLPAPKKFSVTNNSASRWRISLSKQRIEQKPVPTATPVRVGTPLPFGKSEPLLERGWFSASTTPWSNVYVDGKKQGETPVIDLKLIEGRHKVRFENSEAKLCRETFVMIRPNKTTKLTNIDLKNQLTLCK